MPSVDEGRSSDDSDDTREGEHKTDSPTQRVECPWCEGFGYGVNATDGTFIVPGDEPCKVCGGAGTVARLT